MCQLYPCSHLSTRLVNQDTLLSAGMICHNDIISLVRAKCSVANVILHLQPTAATPVPPTRTEAYLVYPKYVGLYDYDSRADDELSFKRGDLMYIIDDKKQWWFARMKDSGKEGYIPINYVAEYAEE